MDKLTIDYVDARGRAVAAMTLRCAPDRLDERLAEIDGGLLWRQVRRHPEGQAHGRA